MRLPPLLMPMDGASIASYTISAPCIKFLCSHGGKILPRPADGQLKYVGGETRVISVATDISFQQLMKKLSYLNNGEMILKYQVVSEELDALVSVKCDEDVGHMFDEILNWKNAEKSRQLRAFLFPRNAIVMEKQMGPVDPVAMEQRYLDAINGIIRFEATTTATTTSTSLICRRQHRSPSPISVRRHAAGSCMSSPRSPESCTTTAEATNNYHKNSIGRMIKMHKVKSSPNICCTNAHLHQHHVNHHQSPKPALDLHKGEKLVSNRSMGHHGNGYHDDCGNHFSDIMGNRPMNQVSSIARLAHSMGGGTTFEKI